MGTYYTHVELDFSGNGEETEMLKKLLVLMDKEGKVNPEIFKRKRYVLDDIIQNALMGRLEDRGPDSGFHCRYFPDFSLNLAPMLFASLFPESVFTYYASWSYSVGGGETAIKVEYKNKTFVIYECKEEVGIENLWKTWKQLNTDSEIDDNNYVKVLKEYKELQDGEEFNDRDVCDKLDYEELTDLLFDINGPKEVEVKRYADYEKSFFDGENLLDYLKETV